MSKIKQYGEALLAWYDLSRREFPWRAPPGERADPYAVWLSEVMLQQTTTAAVVDYFDKFLRAWPNVEALAAAPRENILSAWAGLGYYSRARNLHMCAQKIVADHGGVFPSTAAGLQKLPGIGPYTAAAIAAIAFDEAAIVVDGNIERVMARFFALETPFPAAKKQIPALVARIMPDRRAGDFAQSLMDLGATICAPRKAACLICPLSKGCQGFEYGAPENFPVKAAKKPRPRRRGTVFFLIRPDGAVLTRTRPEKGLLGGMEEFFSSDWREDDLSAAPPRGAPFDGVNWAQAGAIEHVFTHFALTLDIWLGRVAQDAPAPQGARWRDRKNLDTAALPTVMRKVLAQARKNLGFCTVA